MFRWRSLWAVERVYICDSFGNRLEFMPEEA